MTAALPATAGLLRRESPGADPVPLVGVRARAEIRGTAARLTLTQRFRNAESQPLEAVYVFPLEEGSAICGFEVEIDGRRLTGEVEAREKAFELYDDALAAGHGGYLLDEERPDVFTLSLGNLPPGAEAAVNLRLVSELLREGEALRFLLPTTIAPRYAPVEHLVGVGETPASRLNPPREPAVPYALDFEAEIDLGRPLAAVESPTHPISVELLEGQRARVSLGERATAMDRDLVLLIRPREAGVPLALVERHPGGGWAAQLSFAPRLETSAAPCEVVFLVDCSGSMDGQSLEEARNALQLSLSSLTPDQRFDIVSFGSTHRRLFGASRPYDEASLAAARAHVAGLRADLGGTEILPALADVLVQPLVPGLPRQLLVLTDGQVTNTDEVVALARRHSGDTRVFAFGIGAGVDTQLVKGLARAGEGAAEFIEPGERVEAKVLRQLRRLLTPGFSDVRVDWDGATVRQAPHYAPPVFADGRVIVYGLGQGQPPATAVLRARGPAGEVEWHLPIDGQAAGEGTLLGTLAARTLIRDLEEGLSPLHDRRGSLQRRGRSAESRVEQEIVELAQAWSLASRHTSFVAVETREKPTEGEAVLRRVPIALQRGWGGRDRPDLQCCRPAPPMLASFALDSSATVHELGMEGDYVTSPRARFAASRSAPAPAQASRPARRPLVTLVALQRFDGSWDLTDALAAFLGKKLGELLALVDAPNHQARKALATALALAWLYAEAEADEDEWALLAAKAEAWLDACGVEAPGEGWVELATSLLTPASD